MKWVAAAIRNGALLGLALLMLLSIPLAASYSKTFLQKRRLQMNLLGSAGETEAKDRTVPVILIGQVNGVHRDNLSGSLDRGNWFMPDNRLIRLNGKPGTNTVFLAYENHLVSAEIELIEGTESTVTLDAGLAPDVPDLLIIKSSGTADFIFKLPVQNAEKITLENAPDGVSIKKIDGQFEISIPQKHLQKNFISFSVLSTNEFGTSKTYVGITSPAPEPLIEIRTPEEFSKIRNNLTANYLLMNDLDFSAIDNWVPIGSNEFPFSGVFDGNGFEIKGFHLIDPAFESGSFSLFGACKNAVIRNTTLRDAYIEVQNLGNETECFSALSHTMHQSFAENNAVVGGKITAGNGGASGMFCSFEKSIFRDLFNSADVFSSIKERVMRNTGGIVGGGSGYITRCANEGTISGRHLTGGIIGWGSDVFLSHCINSGQIYGQPLVGEFPPGAIIQTVDAGIIHSSLFLRGSAERGGSLFGEGVINEINVIEPGQLKDPAALDLLGSFEGDSAQWEFTEKNASGPIPKGIFRRSESDER
jgi:hypothetical protein